MNHSASPSMAGASRAGRSLAVLLIVASLAGLPGCETLTNASSGLGHAVGIKDDTTASTVGGGVLGFLGGCGAGAVAGLLSGGGGNAIKGCLAGGVIGGVGGALAARHEQLKEAKALADATKSSGMKVTVSSATVASSGAASGASGTASTDERLKTLRVAVPDTSIAAHDPGVVSAAEKVGKIAALSPNGATISVSGPAANRDWLVAQIKQGIPADSASKVQFVASAASHSEIVVTPAVDSNVARA
ncbi:hypothetical protein [Burkholderia pseudomallei]|uniref:hypothetical protein n=1 Tax=Burkholderia pseudomallei TaxID=28450 RepID=UPI000F29271E|nr:hypothetical protein [Burkholderia pseudomallei]CAJ3071624.1 Uncharacterised protein [Burkholderia pseudomallei]VCK72908.1 Uncharacterised protein [Burkholderia pseudomallei]VCK79961.1 Uncharacterised protein [Burkholderia pseudomallei]VCK80060.1 Uncharacterised protein [Burkholderia pseudomallei]VCK80815.1 Uncharacterised protein [Burkholderia pseudomallei]